MIFLYHVLAMLCPTSSQQLSTNAYVTCFSIAISSLIGNLYTNKSSIF